MSPDAKRLKLSFRRVRISNFLRKNQGWETHFLSGFDLRKTPLVAYECLGSEKWPENKGERWKMFFFHAPAGARRGFGHNPLDWPWLTQCYDIVGPHGEQYWVPSGELLDWRNLPDWCSIKILEDGRVVPKEFKDDETVARKRYREELVRWIKDQKRSLADWKQFDPKCSAVALIEKEVAWCEQRLAQFDRAEAKRKAKR